MEQLFTRAFVLAFVANFLHSLAFHTFLHIPGFLQILGASEVEIGVVFATMAATAIVARPAIGRLIDVRGRRLVALVGGCTHVFACLSYLLIADLGPWIYVVRAVHGLAEAALFSVLFTIAADIVPSARRTEGIALFGISGMIPLSLGGLLGDFVLRHASYSALFLVTAAAAAVGLAATIPLPDSRPAIAEADEPPRSFIDSVLQRDLRPVWFVGFTFAIAVASYFTFIKTYVIETRIGTVGLFFTAYAVAAVVLRILLGWVPDRIGVKRTLYPALSSTVLGLVLLAGYRTPVELATAGVLCGVGHGYAFPIVSALVVTRARSGERGAALSMFTALFDLGVFIGSPLLGLAAQMRGYPTMFAIAAGSTVGGIVVFGWWDRSRP